MALKEKIEKLLEEEKKHKPVKKFSLDKEFDKNDKFRIHDNTKIKGYLRISTDEQSQLRQKDMINNFCRSIKAIEKLDFFEITISSRRSSDERKIFESLMDLNEGDILVIAELSRLGRSTSETLNLINKIINLGLIIHIVDINLTLDINNQNDLTTKVLITMFAMLGELERDIISTRTKDTLQAKKNGGVKLGKPDNTIQKSKYDPFAKEIVYYLSKQTSLKKIINNYIHFGSERSLFDYINRRGLKDKALKLSRDIKLEDMKPSQYETKLTKKVKASIQQLENK